VGEDVTAFGRVGTTTSCIPCIETGFLLAAGLGDSGPLAEPVGEVVVIVGIACMVPEDRYEARPLCRAAPPTGGRGGAAGSGFGAIIRLPDDGREPGADGAAEPGGAGGAVAGNTNIEVGRARESDGALAAATTIEGGTVDAAPAAAVVVVVVVVVAVVTESGAVVVAVAFVLDGNPRASKN